MVRHRSCCWWPPPYACAANGPFAVAVSVRALKRRYVTKAKSVTHTAWDPLRQKCARCGCAGIAAFSLLSSCTAAGASMLPHNDVSDIGKERLPRLPHLRVTYSSGNSSSISNANHRNNSGQNECATVSQTRCIIPQPSHVTVRKRLFCTFSTFETRLEQVRISDVL